jgi:hypothetical protein
LFVVLKDGRLELRPISSEDAENSSISSFERAIKSIHWLGGIDFESVVAEDSFLFCTDSEQVVSRLLIQVIDIEVKSFRLQVVEDEIPNQEFVVPIHARPLTFDSKPSKSF